VRSPDDFQNRGRAGVGRLMTAVAAHPPAGERHRLNEIDIVRDISCKFEQARIAYMLTGSMAMNYYAQPRMTRDIDVVIAIGPKDVRRLIDLFRPDYYVSEQSIRESLVAESIFNLIHNESVIKVDCIVRKTSEYRKAEFERRQKISILDFTTYIVSKEDLIISKLFWAKDSHSELQLGDVKNLLATGYDSDYLRHWTRELNLDSLAEECLRD
jgi:hypothetical protein